MIRTYPNQITREGVMGNEYNRWSTRVTPEHKLTLPFTRFLAGPADFTPGGFLNRQPSQFKMNSRAAEVNCVLETMRAFVRPPARRAAPTAERMVSMLARRSL